MIDPGTSLEEILVACLEAGDVDAALELACRDHPEQARKLRRVFQGIVERGLLGPSGDPALPARIGRFEIRDRLGQGGMGIVYRAFEDPPGREVALKVVRGELLHLDGSLARFRREVEAAAKLSHPSILPLHAVGDEGGQPWFSMPIVRGCSLADALDDVRAGRDSAAAASDLWTVVARRAGGETLPSEPVGWADAVVRVLRQVASAAQHAHQHGVLHRDIKPSNVLLTPDGRALLVDFGLALTDDDQRLTRSHAELGSLPYMAPEQVRGDVGIPGPRLDVYGLGVTLFEALTLVCPFLGPTAAETRRRVLSGHSPALRSLGRRLPRDLETVCLKAMSREPEQRYATAAALLDDLDRWLGRRPVQARPAGPWLRLRRWQQRHAAASLAALVGACACAGAAALLWWQERSARQTAERLIDRAEYARYVAEVALAARHSVSQSTTSARAVLAKCDPRFRAWEWRHIMLGSDATLRILTRHAGKACSLSVSADETLIATGSEDKTARLLDLATGRLLHEWPHPALVRRVAIAPGGDSVVTSATDGVLRVFDARSGELRRAIESGGARLMPVFLDEERFFAAAETGEVVLWSCRTAQAVDRWLAHSPRLTALALSPDRQRLATQGGGMLRVWSWPAKQLVYEGRTEHETGNTVAFVPPDGDALSLTMNLRTGEVALESHDVVGARRRWRRLLRTGATFAVAEDGRLAVELLQIRRLTDDGLDLTLPGSDGILEGLVFSRRQPRLWALEAPGTLREFATHRARHRTSLRPHRRSLAGLAVDPSGRLVVSADTSGLVALSDVEENRTLCTAQAHDGRVQHVSVLDDDRVLSVDKGGRLRLHALAGLRPLADRELLAAGAEATVAVVARDQVWIGCLDGSLVGCGIEDGVERARHAVGRKVTALANDPVHGRLAIGDDRGRVYVVDGGGTPRALEAIGSQAVTALCFSPDGRLLLATASDPEVVALDVANGTRLRRWAEDPRPVSALAFGADGRRFFTVGWDGTLRVFDPELDASIYQARVSRVMLLALAYSAPGDFVVTGGIEGTVEVLHGRSPPPWRD